MSITITESGLVFGEYDEFDVFHIEKTEIYKSLCKNESIKTVEFILHKDDKIFFIEAKSSSPKELSQDCPFICELYEKFLYSIEIYFSVILGRLSNKEMPTRLQKINYSNKKIILLLVINGHRKDWLSPIMDALKLKLKDQCKVWGIEPVVMNHEQAMSYGLLK